MLIQRAAAARGESPTPAALDALLGRFFHHYEDLETSGESDARAYPGVDVTLRRLREADLHLAVVTNKHRRFADALLQRLDLLRWVDVIVGGDTCERRKPDPQPLLYACDSLGVTPGEALMVGDSINDVLAARAASLPIICVPYGYNEGQDPRSLPCDAMVDTLAELPALFWPPG
jgi:phosphoglycolate phosphatase